MSVLLWLGTGVVVLSLGVLVMVPVLWDSIKVFESEDMERLTIELAQVELVLNAAIDRARADAENRAFLTSDAAGRFQGSAVLLDKYDNAFIPIESTFFRSKGVMLRKDAKQPVSQEPRGEVIYVFSRIFGNWYYYESS